MRAHGAERRMTHAQIALHLRPAQIEIAVLQTDLLGGGILVRDRKWRRERDTQNFRLGGGDFDLAGRQLRVDRALRAPHYASLYRDIELRSHLMRDLVSGGRAFGI